MSNNGEEAPVSTDCSRPGTPNSASGQARVASSSDRVSITNTTNLACVACRSKHLKCDGLRVCSRCASQGLSCVYLKSRRGYRGSGVRGQQFGSMNRSSALDSTEQVPHTSATPSREKQLSMTGATSSSSYPYGTLNGATFISTANQFISKTSGSMSPDVPQRCIDAFYHYFHGSHPFLPPRHYLLQLLKARPIDHLLTAICYVGSRYITGVSTASFALDLELLTLSPPVRDVSMVQTMLLYALGLNGEGEQTKARDVLVTAQYLALEIGLNTQEFAVTNGQGSPIWEESLRRSWYELYVVCVMVAGFHGRRAFHVPVVKSNVHLPCEEREFDMGSIPPLHTLDEFEEDSFTDDDIEWSSYTYRLAAIRNLDRILQSSNFHLPDIPSIHRQEAYLTNWKLHLPESKRVCYDEMGTFDEMLFQGHMITEVSFILLHQHYARLETLAVQTITSCSRGQVNLAQATDNLHSIKTAHAAANISRLVTFPTPLINHTHFFVCSLTLSSIAHLSLWSALPVIAKEEDLKEQIRMNAGALRTISDIWPSARAGFGQVSKAAQMIYAKRKDTAGDLFWRDFMQEDVMTGLLENTTRAVDPHAEQLLDENNSGHS